MYKRQDWKPYEMLVWCIVGLAAAPSNWLWQRLSDRAGPWTAMIAAYLLEAVGVVAAALGEHLLAIFLGALLLGGTFMAITALGLAGDAVVDVQSEEFGLRAVALDGDAAAAAVPDGHVGDPGRAALDEEGAAGVEAGPFEDGVL